MDEKQALERAVKKIFSAWTALQIAISQGWANNTVEKGKWFPEMITEWVLNEKNKKNFDQSDIEDTLFEIMQVEFETVCDDDSCKEVADIIMQFLKSIARADFNEYSRLMDSIKCNSQSVKNSQVELKDNSDTEGESEDENQNNEVKSEVKSENRSKPEPIIDDDGFEMVVTKKSNKKSKKLEQQIQAQMDLMNGDDSNDKNVINSEMGD